jgi:hypothetical protein
MNQLRTSLMKSLNIPKENKIECGLKKWWINSDLEFWLMVDLNIRRFIYSKNLIFKIYFQIKIIILLN